MHNRSKTKTSSGAGSDAEEKRRIVSIQIIIKHFDLINLLKMGKKIHSPGINTKTYYIRKDIITACCSYFGA